MSQFGDDLLPCLGVLLRSSQISRNRRKSRCLCVVVMAVLAVSIQHGGGRCRRRLLSRDRNNEGDPINRKAEKSRLRRRHVPSSLRLPKPSNVTNRFGSTI
jgi:hypothetical protein